MSFCQNCISPSNSEANRGGADAESPVPLFFSFALAQEKRSEIVFFLGLVGGVSVSIQNCREISELFKYFSPRQQWPLARKKIPARRFARADRVHYRDLEHAHVY